jgi:uncharacterized membrane protein YcaP (DUF421 family)
MENWSDLFRLLITLVSIYLAALVIVRLMGKRALGELSLFDLVIMVGIGEVIVIVGLEQKVPFIRGLIILIVLGGLEFLLSFLTFKSKFFSRIIEGKPTILIKDGNLIEPNMAKEHISYADLRQELRKQGVSKISKVSTAMLEACGKFSVVLKDDEEYNMEQRILKEVEELHTEIYELRAEIRKLLNRKGF